MFLGLIQRKKILMNHIIEKIGQAVGAFNVPGLALAAVKNGELIVSKGFGYRDIESNKPVTPDTIFQMGSTTKALTATVLGMLVDEGKLNWDKPLRYYLPEFRMSDPIISDRVTPRDLVTHRTGMPRHDMLWYNNTASSREEIIRRFEFLELTADLREKYQYSNLMFMTAGYLAGVIEQNSWEVVVQERLFKPLDMARSKLSISDSERDSNVALPYMENDNQVLERKNFRDTSLIGPAGSLASSVNEMARWLQFNLDGGQIGGRQQIESSTLRDLHSAHMPTGEHPYRPEFTPASYGMGWVIDHYRGRQRVSHNGGFRGFLASAIMFPDDGVGLVVVNNRGSDLTPWAALTLTDYLLELEPIDWIGEGQSKRAAALAARPDARQRKKATRCNNAPSPHPVSAYAGHYFHPGYGAANIEVIGENLRVGFNDMEFDLEHWHYSVWNGLKTVGDEGFENTKFSFYDNFDGDVASIEVALESRTKPIRFEKQPAPKLFDPGYLDRLVGTYLTPTDYPITIARAGSAIRITGAGEPSGLTPNISGRFTIDEGQQLSLEFVLDGKAFTEKLLIHSEVYVTEAKRKASVASVD